MRVSDMRCMMCVLQIQCATKQSFEGSILRPKPTPYITKSEYLSNNQKQFFHHHDIRLLQIIIFLSKCHSTQWWHLWFFLLQCGGLWRIRWVLSSVTHWLICGEGSHETIISLICHVFSMRYIFDLLISTLND